MAEQTSGWSLSFSGCGFMGFYHVGVTQCLSEHAPQLLRDAPNLLGSSGGALHCATFLCGLSLESRLQILMDLVRSARKRNIGVLHPSFNLSKYLRDGLNKFLPSNAHRLLSGKMVISVTRVSDRKNVLISDFDSKKELVDALVCSSFIPFYCGLIPPTYRGVRYMDGGASNNMPFINASTTITISPFYGEHDICPKIKSTNFLHVNITNHSLRLCSGNIYLLARALFPPELKVLAEICLRGYLDAFRFLEEKGICDSSPSCLNVPSEERESEVTSSCSENGSPPTSLKRQSNSDITPEAIEFIDHLRLNIIPWDEDILKIVSPEVYLAMGKAMKEKGGYLTKIFNCLPVRIASYMMLPCTLPVESVIFAAQRLVRWFSDMPNDLEWLQWAAYKIFGLA
ncbi:1-acylglycerol-3-phosphate O-acyltransferase PNPLA3 [Sarcophilus harrisii]|uniref:Acylglycerol transacylase n=1 Tax=Sarcophilus harrisii TaxID=9305 RepID=G3VID8_SARHA|nr:1-acylglycerol-3-phosphate O-acyltransferase PNPLA3 [Sarcophilus harrisii]XP_031797004.1 1-acylglycerol-3-phosphate O-acyltransferase PNPLA3 [Sarcophilus harrisii]